MAVDDSLFMKDVNFDGALTILFKVFQAAKRVQKKVQEGPEPEHEKLLEDVVESTAREGNLEQNAPTSSRRTPRWPWRCTRTSGASCESSCP